MAKFLAQISILMVAYFGASLVTQWKPLITDYASAVWPPSGVALAGLLIFGRSRWPGVWLGAIFSNIFHIAEMSGEAWTTLGPVLQSTAISSAATLEAILGAFLISRLLGSGQWFSSGTNLIKMLLLGGPVACLVAAALGPLTLMVGGVIDSDALLFNMFTWWVGDCIGVLVIAPIILIWSPALGYQWNALRWTVGSGLLIVLVVIVFFLGNVNEANQKKADAAIHEHTVVLTKDIEARFETSQDLLHSLATYVKLTPNISRDLFEKYSQPMLDRHLGIQALEWVPVISKADRRQFEEKAAVWYSGYFLNERTPERNIVPAKARPVYYPVALVAPMKGNEKALGFDLGSNVSRLRAIERARDTGNVVATEAITLVQERDEQKAILTFMPVYGTSPVPTTLEERRATIVGYILGIFRIGDWLEGVFGRWNGPLLPLSIAEVDDTGVGKEIFRSKNTPKPSGRDVMDEIHVADKVWRITYFTRNAPEFRQASITAWLTLVGGFLVAVLLDAVALMAVSRDNFTRRLVEKRTTELSASENRLRTILDTVLDSIITIDATGAILSANPAAERLFGWRFEEIAGKNVKLLMPDPYRAEHDGYINAYLTTGIKKIVGNGREVVGLRKDGSMFPMELAVSEMCIDGSIYFAGVVRDISERKRLDRLKSEFVSTVSHELRTPLTSIRGALNLVLRNPLETVSDKSSALLEIAERNSERLTLLINDLLDLEKIESNRLEFNFQMVDLVLLARRALQDNEGYASRHDVSLTITALVDRAMVKGDAHRISQVFANLISNAAKFSPKKACVEVIVEARENLFRVSVKDQGPGISEEFRARIFQRFAQADSTDSREKGGTGLGLSIAKAIVDHHNGNIGYESTDGLGTTFYFELPARSDDLENVVSKQR